MLYDMYHFCRQSRKRYIKNDNNQDRHIYCIDDETDTFLRVQWFPLFTCTGSNRTAERIEPVDQIRTPEMAPARYPK